MKKLLALLVLALLVATPAMAELKLGSDPLISKIPAVENAWVWDFSQSELINATGMKILSGKEGWSKGLELSAYWGTGVDDEDRTANLVLASVGYRIGSLATLFNLDYPL